MKKLKKLLVIVATISCMLLALALTTMAYNLETSPGEGPASGTANENSFLFTPVTVEDVEVHIGGNGNSARLSVVIPGFGTYTTNERPVNNVVNTIFADGFEIDVFVRGNKIDGVLGVWDLNCYNTCPTVGPDGDGCKPTRTTPCICECICVWECIHICDDVECINGGICDEPLPCDNSECKDKPDIGEHCAKDGAWPCPWECACICECGIAVDDCRKHMQTNCECGLICIPGCDPYCKGEGCWDDDCGQPCTHCTCEPEKPPCDHNGGAVCDACKSGEGANHENCGDLNREKATNYFCVDCEDIVGQWHQIKGPDGITTCSCSFC